MGIGVSQCGPHHFRRSDEAVRAAYEHHYGRPRPAIEHVVVLMLENRTFDNVYGCWMDRRMKRGEVHPSKWDVHAQAGKGLYDFWNVVVPHDDPDGEGTKFPVWSRDPRTDDVMSQEALGVPNGDPAEKFELLNKCVYEETDPGPDAEVSLGGFAQQYYEREVHDAEELKDVWGDRTDFAARRSPAMHVFLPEQMHIFTELGEAFGVSDTYFSSAPCQTWPNRLFAANGHCYGYVNNLSDRGEAYDHDKMNMMETMMRTMQFDHETVFNRLLKSGVEWAIFYGDCPLSVMLNKRLQDISSLERTYPYKDFAGFCKEGSLPPFSWIEPQYLKGTLDGSPPNDMHPPHNVLYGQQLVADIYNSLRGNEELWKKTLFLVTCDEGVGVFDHVPPPAAPDPKKGYWHRFHGQTPPHQMGMNPFTRYGTRVPLLIATPFLDEGSVVRPEDEFSEYPFDHASIIRTVFDLFVGPHCHLTNRDKLAPSLAPYLRATPRESSLGPKHVTIGTPPPLVDHGAVRPQNPTRGGCHSVDFLKNSAVKFAKLAAGDTTALPGVQQVKSLLAHFEDNRAGKQPHWLEMESEDGTTEVDDDDEVLASETEGESEEDYGKPKEKAKPCKSLGCY